MRYLKITISYDGTDYVGWQIQENGISIQQRLEEAWSQVTGEALRFTASGRTDAGVHAKAQVCSIRTASTMDVKTIQRALNATAPFDIGVLNVEEAGEGFHAIRDAVSKTYRYQIQHGRIMDVLSRRFHWYVTTPLNVEAMVLASKHLIGKHDFSSFEGAGSPRTSSVRQVTQLDVVQRTDGRFNYLDVVTSADGFLYNMVRNIVGTLVQVGKGSELPEWVLWVREQRDRKCAGQNAPAHALFLEQVNYD